MKKLLLLFLLSTAVFAQSGVKISQFKRTKFADRHAYFPVVLHDSTLRVYLYDFYKWKIDTVHFFPRTFNMNVDPSTDTSITNHYTIDSMDIWYNSGQIKYWSKHDDIFKNLSFLNGTHIDPTGVYARKVVTNALIADSLIADSLEISGVLKVGQNARVSGLVYTWKQATDPYLSSPQFVYPSQIWFRTTDLATYQRNALNTDWDLIIPGLWQAPSGSGLHLTDQYMGHYSGGQFQTYIRNNGYFYFKGDVNNYISWLGDTLKIKGKIIALNPQDFPKGATVFRQDTAPSSGMVTGDVWLETDNGDAPHSYDGASWIRTYTSISGGDIVTGTIAVNKLIVGTLTGYTLQTTGNDNARVRINGSNNRIEWVKADNTVGSYLDQSGGNMVLNGIMDNTSGIITGGTIQTATSGARAVLTGTGLTFYDNLNANIGSLYGNSGNAFWSNNLEIVGNLNVGDAGGNFGYSLTLHNGTLSPITPFSVSLTSDANSNTLLINGVAAATQYWVGSQGYLTGYPGAGIAVSTGSTWGTSITDNSSSWNSAAQWVSDYGSGSRSNWDAAYNDKINSASFNTSNGIITLTQQDAGTVTVDIDGRFEPSFSTLGIGKGGTGHSGTYFTNTKVVYYDGVNDRLASSSYAVSDFSLTTHNHDSAYATVTHNHNGTYTRFLGKLSSAPGSASGGDMYYNTSNNTLYVYDAGTITWEAIATN